MPKSKYPQQLDTSVELPLVRDNILEVGSDVINSLRSAIFQIEKVLGINPQGAVGNTLAERLNRALDGNGNIKTDALELANVLTGPILDADVSKVASIQESKLKLDYPTSLLQAEVSTLNDILTDVLNELAEVSATLSAHIEPTALDRHPATAISVAGQTAVPSDLATKILVDGSVQDTFEELYNAHINYSGEDITADNNSHLANQVYFDTSEVSEVISETDLQGAMEELAIASLQAEITHQDLFHSNGILNVGKAHTAADSEFGNLLADDFLITLSPNSGSTSGLSHVSIVIPISLDDFDLEPSDILTITDANDPDGRFTGSFQIESFTTNGSNQLTALTVFGILDPEFTTTTTGKITKNLNLITNQAGFLISAREEATTTSAKSLQICNPNANRLISSGIKPAEITSTNRYLELSIDDNSVVLDLFDSGATIQSLDTIVGRINEQVAEQAYSFLAYRLDLANRSELVLALNLPDTETEQHTMMVSSSTDNGLETAGFSSIQDITFQSLYGSQYYLNGIGYTDLKLKLDTTDFNFSSGGFTLNSTNGELTFDTLKIKVGDLAIITDADDLDNGSYVIAGISETQLTLTTDQLPSGFSSTSLDGTRLRIYENIISVADLTFKEVSSSFGASVLDIFFDSERNLFYNNRLEYTAQVTGSASLINVVDFKGTVAEDLTLSITSNSDSLSFSLNDGEIREVRGKNVYLWLTSGSEDDKLKIYLPDVSQLNNKLIADGMDSLDLSIFAFPEVNDDQNFQLARVNFDNFVGRFAGGISSSRSLPKFRRGIIGTTDLGDDIKRELVSLPISELRSNGVISGVEITNASITSDDLYAFDLSAGVVYLNGSRFAIAAQSLISDVDSTQSDKMFIAIDDSGNVAFQGAAAGCFSPFNETESVLLASLEFDGNVLYTIDSRLFINDLDLKLLNSITVSPQAGMGHFTELGKALKYAKRFANLYPDAGIPTVHLKAGTYTTTLEFDESDTLYDDWYNDTALDFQNKVPTAEIDRYIFEGLFIDFPVNLEGEGNSSVVKITSKYTFSDTTKTFRGFIGIPGDGFTSHTYVLDKITDGFVRISNLRFEDVRIDILDFNLTDGVDTFNCGVQIDNVIFKADSATFDTTRDTTVNTTAPVAIKLQSYDDTATNQGNLIVTNCKFIDCYFALTNLANLKNLIISYNLTMGESTLPLLSKNLLSFGTATSGSNIVVFGNQHTSNFNVDDDANEPDLSDDASGWGDRIGRDLAVGGDLTLQGSATISGDADITGDVSGASYDYVTALTREKQVFLENLSDSVMGDSDADQAVFSSVTANGRERLCLVFEDTLESFALIRLEILPGETLTSVGIFYTSDSGGSIFGNYQFAIHSEDYFGNGTLRKAMTSGTIGDSDNDVSFTSLSGLSLTGDEGKYFYVRIERVASTGYTEYLLNVLYTTSVSSVEGIGGLT